MGTSIAVPFLDILAVTGRHKSSIHDARITKQALHGFLIDSYIDKKDSVRAKITNKVRQRSAEHRPVEEAITSSALTKTYPGLIKHF